MNAGATAAGVTPTSVIPTGAEIGIEVVPRHPPLRGAGGRHDDQ
ncbi:MAG: hypothetical protein ACXWP6_04170 [Ktedonobacterales bacterium]